MSEIRHLNRPGGETGIHEGLKIPWIHTPCGFESRPGHQYQTFRFLPDRFGRAKRGKVWKHWLAAHGAARQAQVRNPLRF